jgi:HEAT repeat protein
MPSRLSSLLVRDGLVGVKRMEKAFQRQVIYGGSLDTILLEMNLISEERLGQYLALASGLPPATRDEANVFDTEAVAKIPRDVAEKHRVVPLVVQDDALRILVCDPVDMTLLEDLADVVDISLQPLIVPEYRWHVVFHRTYGDTPPARFSTLARQTEGPLTAPVGRARSVIVDDPDHVVVDVPVTKTPTQPGFAPGPVRAIADGPAVSRTQTPTGLPPMPGRATRAPTLPGMVPVAHPPPQHARRAPTAPPVAFDVSPISPADARTLLEIAEDRDTIFVTILRAVRSRTRWAGLLTVQGGAAIGRIALAEAGVDVSQIASVLIPLDVVTPFRTTVTMKRPYVGTMLSGDPGVDAMALRMGGAIPPGAMILPIVLRDRVVALVVGHRLVDDLVAADVADVLALGAEAADAVSRLIVKHKAAGYRAPTEPGLGAPTAAGRGDGARPPEKRRSEPVMIATEDVTSKNAGYDDGGGAWRAGAAQPAIDYGTELSIDADPPRPASELVDVIEGSDEAAAQDAMDEAVERFEDVLPLIAARFPGKLRVGRYTVSGRHLRAAQYGGLLELAVRIGPPIAELLVARMAVPDRDVRFYATVCVAELRPRNAINALVERLFDPDYGVRACAIEALAGYPLRDLAEALGQVRRALHTDDAERALAACNAIGELTDIDSIPALIESIELDRKHAEHARRTLSTLSRQDFGLSARKWRKWWEDARTHHRVEWLIDALNHKDDHIRQASIEELRRLTGEYFGYHHDLGKREREAAVLRWQHWWLDNGRRRFVRGSSSGSGVVEAAVTGEGERSRPTAQTPAIRDK